MSRGLTVAGFLVVAAALAGLAILARVRPDLVPSPDRLLRAAQRTQAGRLALLAGWAWAGWHVLAR